MKSQQYLTHVGELLGQAAASQLATVNAFAREIANTLQARRRVFLFGTGHSCLLAQELFYRAGGLVRLQPILEPELMLHLSASESTQHERNADLAIPLLAKYGVAAGDLLLIISNSGRNPLIVELALQAKSRGCTVVALTSLQHSTSGSSRHTSGQRLCEIAHLVLDNLGTPGDACVAYDGFAGMAAATSTVIGAALLQAAAAQVVQCLLNDGTEPEVFASSNIDQGDAINEAYLNKYREEILYL
ncbi:MAG: SIS domain-containing protein [Oscillospiraceae bacterium]|nr:SIS domain-containing protein [Oscillospiraceae bacterium]